MLNHFIQNFNPSSLDYEQLIQEVRSVTPAILALSPEEQLFHWEWIGYKITDNQQMVITEGISDLLITEQQKETYSKGIIFLSFDIAEFNQSLATLKNIENPDNDLLGAIAAMEELQRELEKTNRKPKM